MQTIHFDHPLHLWICIADVLSLGDGAEVENLLHDADADSIGWDDQSVLHGSRTPHRHLFHLAFGFVHHLIQLSTSQSQMSFRDALCQNGEMRVFYFSFLCIDVLVYVMLNATSITLT